MFFLSYSFLVIYYNLLYLFISQELLKLPISSHFIFLTTTSAYICNIFLILAEASGKEITVKWIKSSFTVEIDGTTTLSSFTEKLLDHWDDLVRVDFSLHNSAGSEINNDEKFASVFLVAKTN